MIRREGRLDSAQTEAGTSASAEGPHPVVVRNWERPVFVLALIVILVLGCIGGLNALIGLVPR